jgi:hypothetical protein
MEEMIKFFKYIRYSNINLSINLNPFCWGFDFLYEGPSSADPNMYFVAVKLLMCRLTFIIDDGSYNIDDKDTE